MTTHLTIQDVACPKCSAAPLVIGVDNRFAAISRRDSAQVQEYSENGTCEQCKTKVARINTRVVQKTGEDDVKVILTVALSPAAYIADRLIVEGEEALTGFVDFLVPNDPSLPLQPLPHQPKETP